MPSDDPREGKAARLTDLLDGLNELRQELEHATHDWVKDELYHITLEILMEVGSSISIPTIGMGLEDRDFPPLTMLRTAAEAAKRDLGERPKVIDGLEDPIDVVRELNRRFDILESVRRDEQAYVPIGPTIAVEIEPKVQALLTYFAAAKIAPMHLRQCVYEKLINNERLLEFLHHCIRNEVQILGQIQEAQVPIGYFPQPQYRDCLARTLAHYMTAPHSERLARIDEVTPDGFDLPGLALILMQRDEAQIRELPSADEAMPFILYKVSTLAERLLNLKSSVINGALRARSLRWTFFAKHFVEDQPSELDARRLIYTLRQLLRNARWRAMHKASAGLGRLT